MKSDFNISVQINIGVTPEVVALAQAFLCKVTPQVLQPTPTVEAEEVASDEPPTEQPEEAPQAKKRGRKPKEKNDDPSAPVAEAVEEHQEVEPKNEPQAETPSELTEEDIRAAMHRTRQRFEGENYKEHTDSPEYVKYHKALTAQFKNIAALLGSDRPTLLPSTISQEAAQSFIRQCDELIIDEDGSITTKAPF